MTIKQNTPYTSDSEQRVLNLSRDDDYNVIAVEILGENEAGTDLVRIRAKEDGSVIIASTEYSVNDIDEASSTITYIGKEKSDGTWLVQKIDTTTGTSMQYASETNNSSYTTYDTAWTARASLTYTNYSGAM